MEFQRAELPCGILSRGAWAEFAVIESVVFLLLRIGVYLIFFLLLKQIGPIFTNKNSAGKDITN